MQTKGNLTPVLDFNGAKERIRILVFCWVFFWGGVLILNQMVSKHCVIMVITWLKLITFRKTGPWSVKLTTYIKTLFIRSNCYNMPFLKSNDCFSITTICMNLDSKAQGGNNQSLFICWTAIRISVEFTRKTFQNYNDHDIINLKKIIRIIQYHSVSNIFRTSSQITTKRWVMIGTIVGFVIL